MDMQELVAKARKDLNDGNLPRARQLFERLLSNPAQRAEAYCGLGFIEIRAQNWHRAAAFLETALESPGQHEDLYYYLGVVREKMGQANAARKAYEMALHLNPKHVKARSKLTQLSQAMAGASTSQEQPKRQAPPSPPAEFHIPRTAEELAEYKRLRTEKAKADFWIDNWHRYPLFTRVIHAVIAVVVLAVLVAGLSFAVGTIIKARFSGTQPSQAHSVFSESLPKPYW